MSTLTDPTFRPIEAWQLSYDLKCPEITRHNKPLGYIYDQRLVILAPSLEEAVTALRNYHANDKTGTPEGIKIASLGLGAIANCVSPWSRVIPAAAS